MKQSAIVVLTALSVLTLSSCSKKKQTPSSASSPVRVEIKGVGISQIDDGRQYSGVIEESSGTTLSFKIPGTIRSIAVSEGDKVAKGQLIASLDDSSLRSNYDIALSTLSTAQDTYNRMKTLHEAGALPDIKWVEVENTLSSAKSAVQIAKNALDDTRIYAPFTGIVSQKFADAGSTAAPAVPVVKLVEISPVKATISVSEQEIGAIPAGSSAEITVDALDGAKYTGTLVDKGVAANPLSRTYSVKFLVDNPGGRLLPGMLCNVTLQLADSPTTASAIVLPLESVLLDSDNTTFVWLDKGGKAERRKVTMGDFSGADGVVITDGLQPGDSVIVRGMQKVSTGMNVEPIK